MIRDPLDEAAVLALPPLVDVPTAGRALGIGRSTAYALAAAGEFPVAVLRIGPRVMRVRSSELRRLLLVDASPPRT